MQVTDRHERIIEFNSYQDLKDAIEELNKKKEMQEAVMAFTVDEIKDSLKPKNLFKAAVHKVTDGEDALSLGLKIGGTIAAAIITKKIITKYNKKDENDHEVEEKEPESSSIIAGIARTALTTAAMNSLPTIKAYVTAAFQNLFIDKETKIINFNKIKDGKQ